jgi:hypothetical protein
MLAFSVNANRRHRPVRTGAPSVEAVVSVLYLNADGTLFVGEDGKWKYCAVLMSSVRPLTLGTTFTGSVQKPGATEFTFLASSEVEPQHVGFLKTLRLYLRDGFYDILPDGSHQDWLPGIATFKVDIVTAKGERTSVFQKVPVRLDGLRVPFGPLQQAIPSADGKSVLLVGVFPTPPTAMLFHFFADGSYFNKPATVSQNQFTVPEGMSGLGMPLTVMSGYPDAECSTVQVDIPPVSQQQGKSLFSE